MTRPLVLLGATLAAVAWLVHQPAYQHDTPHKQAGALIAITVPFLVLDIILSIRKSRRARARSSSSPARSTGRAKAGAGRW
jgi:hypothetical protein